MNCSYYYYVFWLGVYHASWAAQMFLLSNWYKNPVSFDANWLTISRSSLPHSTLLFAHQCVNLIISPFVLCNCHRASKPANMASEGLGSVIQTDRVGAKSSLASLLKAWQEVHVPVCMTNVSHCAGRRSLFPLKPHQSSAARRGFRWGDAPLNVICAVLCRAAWVGRGIRVACCASWR